MRPSLRTALLGSLLFVAPGCAHGFLGTDYNPKGDIAITNPTTGAVIRTSQAEPYADTTPAFSIGIAETNFGGPYSVTLIKWSNGFNIPCFATHQINVVLFSSDNANPPTDPASQPNPCVFGDGDEETALINDNKGHTLYFYFELDTTAQAANAAARRL